MSLRAARFRAQAVASIIAARYASKCLSGRGRVQTLLTSWRALGMAKSRGVSDECRNSHPPAARLRPALSLPAETGSERELRAAQRVQKVEKRSGTGPYPSRGRRPAGWRIPARRRGPVWRWRPADWRHPARRRIPIVPARAPFRVMPVARVWPLRPVRSPVGRKTTRWCSGICR